VAAEHVVPPVELDHGRGLDVIFPQIGGLGDIEVVGCQLIDAQTVLALWLVSLGCVVNVKRHIGETRTSSVSRYAVPSSSLNKFMSRLSNPSGWKLL
jgi:hypothetical protein